MKILPFFFLFLVSYNHLLADEENYQSYPLGEQASGMGGAYTALSETPEGTFYNPSGIARASHDTISLTATTFRWTRGSIGNAIALTGSRRSDYSVSAVQVIPTSTVYLNKLKGARGFGFSVYVPDSALFSGKKDIENVFFSQQLSNQTLWIGPSLGQAIGSRFLIGASLFFLSRTFYKELYVRSAGTTVAHEFRSTEADYGALLPILGMKYDLTPRIKIGVTLRPYYSIRVTGDGTINISSNTAKTTFEGLKIDTPTPIRSDVGIAYELKDTWSLAGDISISLPHSFTAIRDPRGRLADSNVRQELTLNGAVGTEYYLGKNWPLRFGLFTDLSSAPALENSDPVIRTRTNYLGTTVALGYLTEHSTMGIGAQYSLGLGQATNPAGAPQGFILNNLNLLFAGSYRF